MMRRIRMKFRSHGLKGWMFLAIVIVLIVAFGLRALSWVKEKAEDQRLSNLTSQELAALVTDVSDVEQYRPDLDVQLLTVNPYSRPGIATEEITGIVIHYVGNPGTTAQENRDYFEGLKDSGETYASSHFVVGLEGEVIQCIPTSEIAYASNSRNDDTISIEVCHPDETGKFNDATYNSLVELTGWLCEYLQVSPENVIRHYDITGKECPLYYVEHEDAWEEFKLDVIQWIENHQ